MDHITRFEYLLDRFKAGTASEADTRELMQMLQDPTIDHSLNQVWLNLRDTASPLSSETSEQILQNILSSGTGAKVLPLRIHTWKRRVIPVFAAAASIILIFLAVNYLLYKQSPAPGQVRVASTIKLSSTQIVPGTTRAELVLEDGRKVMLDSVENGSIALQGNMNVNRVNGRIEYITGNESVQPLSTTFNTLRTPKGGFYQLTLSDGTRLWLNAASSLRYPVAFDKNERIVELKGEAYFEVAKDAARPFRVFVNGISVEVKGTHFNVMAYENETAVKTTLLEGSVLVKANGYSSLLTPGQQAKVTPDTRLEVLDDVNTEQVVAWKNGYFHFDRAGLEVLMRQIERWYDVEVEYEGKIQQRSFGGKISRSSNIKDVLRILELNRISFRIENKKIIISNQ